jgi:hypothetical protein
MLPFFLKKIRTEKFPASVGLDNPRGGQGICCSLSAKDARIPLRHINGTAGGADLMMIEIFN